MSENIFQLKVLPGADATVAMQIRLKRELRFTAFSVKLPSVSIVFLNITVSSCCIVTRIKIFILLV
nr:unnamed protein product [Callosobruchus chinensis]CAH7728066.1 unnamed protein product [Callosobruchus chinensis]CAH7746229.1 unnamed protein product [Callosobruchus chinensis]